MYRVTFRDPHFYGFVLEGQRDYPDFRTASQTAQGISHKIRDMVIRVHRLVAGGEHEPMEAWRNGDLMRRPTAYEMRLDEAQAEYDEEE